MRTPFHAPIIAFLTLSWCCATEIHVDAGALEGRYKPIYNWFGYDEPNYTYGQYGPRLLRELSELAPVPVYIRTHNLLTSGNGEPALKWGSTNVYTEDAAGNPVYDWKILDRILDTYRDTHTRPMFEIGFMPEALSVKPQPYRHTWPKGGITAGWSYPPKDYRKWEELSFQIVSHCIERYGRANVATWYWEVWNEPDIGYWKGTPQEYFELYAHAAAGVRRALPTAKVGGPATTGPAGAKAADFLRSFLEYCARTGVPLDFISFHAKGRPTVVDGHVRMGLDKELADVAAGFEIVSSFPKFRSLPVILSEADPEGCAACSARTHPENAYRNGPLYASYTAAALKAILELSARYNINIAGMLTWAFEFEDQPFFEGFRTLATNGIDKPVLNVFRMLGLMEGNRLLVATSNEQQAPIRATSHELRATNRGHEPRATSREVDAIAVRSGNTVTVLLWHYHPDDVPGPDAGIDLGIAGLPAGANPILVEHYRIDQHHSNAYSLWKQMGSPRELSADQRTQLQSAGQLQLLASPEWMTQAAGNVHLHFELPRQGVSLVKLNWTGTK